MLTAAGVPADAEPVPGAGHMFRELDENALTPLVDRTADFLLGRSDPSRTASSRASAVRG